MHILMSYGISARSVFRRDMGVFHLAKTVPGADKLPWKCPSSEEHVSM